MKECCKNCQWAYKTRGLHLFKPYECLLVISDKRYKARGWCPLFRWGKKK